jgi:hypothetical protein
VTQNEFEAVAYDHNMKLQEELEEAKKLKEMGQTTR